MGSFRDPKSGKSGKIKKTQEVDKPCSTPTFLAHVRIFRPPPPAPFPAPSWPRPDLDPESSARATEIPLQKRLYIKAICKILEDFTFPEIPGAIFCGDPLRSSTGGNSDKSCSTPTFLARTSGPATPRVPKGPPKGISRKSPDNLKSLQIRQVL